jgi:2-oxoisovalerate dehydrogenase E2 component (dihydrolipoyl transacylase)
MKLLRHELKSHFSKRGVKISYMPLLIKATSMALKQYPMMNATVNSDVTEMIYHENHNIGIAMDTPKGLVVPVIKQVQNKSVFEIAYELNQLQVWIVLQHIDSLLMHIDY